MTRGGVTQVRTFSYDLTTGRLMSVTTPESGTVSYTYNADGTLASKTDAKNQKVEYVYDNFQRVTEIKRYPVSTGNEDPCQRVSLGYDGAENGWGRLSWASWGGRAAWAAAGRRATATRQAGG